MRSNQVHIAVLLMFSPFLCSCQKIEPARNRIVFQDRFEVVQDSLFRMKYLLTKLPKTYRINYFVDKAGNLYVNNTMLGSLKGAANSKRIRGDMSFEDFTDSEFKSFFILMYFLFRNHVSSASYEPPIREFVFYYRETSEDRYRDLRAIVVNVSGGFVHRIEGKYQVLDQKEKIILLAPYDIRIN